MNQIKQTKVIRVIDAIRNVDGIINQLLWIVALASGHMQIGGKHKMHFQLFQAYTQNNKNIQSNHTLKFF